MNKRLSGSMCLTDILAKAKEGHSAFTRADNGKVYFNVVQWINEQKDKYGNDSSLQLNGKMDKKESEGTVYIGNLKFPEDKAEQTVSAASNDEFKDDLRF